MREEDAKHGEVSIESKATAVVHVRVCVCKCMAKYWQSTRQLVHVDSWGCLQQKDSCQTQIW